MAGAGFKTFNTGDVLTASDVNTYLMQQTVMVFASAAARTTALGANVSQGMISYLKDINEVQTYNGSAWVSSDDPNAIQNSIVTAKGDIVAASGNATPARLAVGSNGYTLVADSAATTGLNYGFSNTNPVINGGMDIWQRGTSIAVGAASVYTVDRWKAFRGGLVAGMTVSRQATSDTTNLPNIQYCARVQRDSGNTSTQNLNFETGIETINSIPFVGKTVTVSFYARKGSNYSEASSQLSVILYSGTGTDQVPDQYTGIANVGSTTATLTTTWQRFSFTATVGTSATEIGVFAQYTPTGTASTNDYFEVTGVQIDLGSTALPFRRSGGTIQGELSACQRYYFRLTSANAGDVLINYAVAGSGTQANGYVQYPVPMRTAPTLGTDYSNIKWVNYAGSGYNMSSVALTAASAFGGLVYGTISGASGGQAGFIAPSSANGYVGLSAEL